MSQQFWRKPGLVLGVLSTLGLLTAVACGGGTVEPTATATTGPAPTATATSSTGVTAEPTATPTSEPTPIPTETPKQGGVIRNNIEGDMPNWDPHTVSNSTFNVRNMKVNTMLLWNPRDKELVADAAESYTISQDGKVWTFKLRPGIKFQSYTPSHPRDGTNMTSADVKWSLEKIMGLHGQVLSPRSGFMKEFVDIDRPDNGIEIVDELTFRIHLLSPFAGLANVLALGFSALIPDGIMSTDMLQRPYSAGPFRIAEIQRGALYRYERYTDYFKPGLPYLDGYRYEVMEGDSTIQAAFITGRLDLGTGYPLKDNEPLWEKAIAEGKIYRIDRSGDCRPQGMWMNPTKPPFNDKRLREIVNLAIDREGYTIVVHNGRAVPHIWLETGVWGLEVEEIQQQPGWRQPQDAAEAKRLFQELYPSGLDVSMMARNTGTYARMNEYIAGELQKIGFRVTIQPTDVATTSSRAAALDYQMFGYYFCQTTMTLEELLSYFITGGSRNWFGLSDPKVDAGYQELAGMSDPAARKVKAQEIERLIQDNMPGAPLPVQYGGSAAWYYVKHLPTYIASYTGNKDELMWRVEA
ncbi:MAG: hypothetical protein HY532_09345 [Chloroflexi bacterium]|nr:hypothetical protein [Chloroflexota bacterium]